MKYIYLLFTVVIALLSACKKEAQSPPPVAAFSFRDTSSSVLKLGTNDTCTLFNTSANYDSVSWSLGNGTVVNDKSLVLAYPQAGTYHVTLTTFKKDGRKDTVSKEVVVLDRVLKNIVINSIYWDTQLSATAGWPATDYADVYVLIQDLSSDPEHLYPQAPSGLSPNAPVIYRSDTVKHVYKQTNTPITINVSGKTIIDKQKINRAGGYLISLIAINATGTYCLFSNLWSGSAFGVMQEDIAANKYQFITSFWSSSLTFNCDYE